MREDVTGHADCRTPTALIPRSLAAGTPIVAVLYLAFDLALPYVLPVGRMSGSADVARRVAIREQTGSDKDGLWIQWLRFQS